MFRRLETVVAERSADASALLPRMRRTGGTVGEIVVFRRMVVAALAAEPRAPAVVDDDRILDRRIIVEPGEKFRSAPHLPGIVPLAVRPDDVRFVKTHQFLELRQIDLLDKLRDVIAVVKRMSPFKKRIVESHVQARITHRFGQFAADIALGSHRRRIEIRGIRRRPERESFMVL